MNKKRVERLVAVLMLCLVAFLVTGCVPDVEKFAEEENVNRLISALKFRGDAEIRIAAAEALGDLQDEKAIPPLINCAEKEKEEEDVRAAAIGALGRFDDREIFEPLITLLKDDSEEIQLAAELALVRQGKDAVSELVDALENDDEAHRQRIIATLARIGTPAQEALIEALSNSNAQVQSGAAAALSAIGEDAMPDLILALDGAEESLQGSIIAILLANEEEAVPFLIESLRAEDAKIAAAAQGALVTIGETAVPALIQIINDPAEEVSNAASEALASIGEPAIPALVDTLSDEGRVEQASAVLQAIGTPTIEALVEILSSESHQEPAMGLLVALGEPAISPLIAALKTENLKEPASQVLIQMGSLAIDPMLAALEEDPELAEPMIGSLIEGLAVYDRTQREKAADALVEIGEPAVPRLIAALKEHHKIVFPDLSVMYASEVLDSPQGTASGSLVSGGFCEEAGDWNKKIVICQRGNNYFYEKVEAVEEGGGVAVILYNNVAEPLITMLGSDFDGDIPVVCVTNEEGKSLISSHINDTITVVSQNHYFNADDALVAMGTTSVPYLIEELPQDTTYVQIESILLQIGSAAVPQLIDALEHEDEYVRGRSISVLREIADKRAVKPIIAAFADRSAVVRSDAAYAMSVFASPEALDPLIALLGDSDPSVVSNASYSLTQYDVSAPTRMLELYADETITYRSQIEEALISYYTTHQNELVMAAKNVCNGTPIENAVSYNRYEAGPHPLIILTSTNDYSYWNTYIPVEWRPYSPEQIQAVVCTDTYEQVVVQVCRYYYTSTGAAAPSKTRYRWKSTGALYNAATARSLGSFTLWGSLPDYCPYHSTSGGSTSISGGYIDYEDMHNWLKAMGFKWE